MANTPHIHAELIKAWADGAEIQWRRPCGTTDSDVFCGIWLKANPPSWQTYLEYRIKPQPPKEPDYAKVCQNAWYGQQLQSDTWVKQWEAAAQAVIKAYQDYQIERSRFISQ